MKQSEIKIGHTYRNGMKEPRRRRVVGIRELTHIPLVRFVYLDGRDVGTHDTISLSAFARWAVSEDET